MRFQRDAPRILIVSIVLVVAGMAFLSNRLFSGLTGAVEQNQFDLMQAIVKFNMSGAETRALARAEMVASLASVREAFAARDRERLLKDLGPLFQIQKEKYGVDQAQFHIPPAVSFLRLHAPDQFGDDLTAFRPMVVGVNRDHMARKGLAIARTGPAIFGVLPMQDAAGQHIGSFEFGMDFAPILDSLKTAYQLELALFMEEEPLHRFAKGMSQEAFSEQNQIGKYIRLHSTHLALMKDLVSDTDLSHSEGAQYTREALGVTYGVILIPLRNNAGEPLGMLAVARDFSSSRAAAGRSLVWQALLAVFAIVLLSGATLIVVRGYVSQPMRMLSERFEALAEGKEAEPIVDAESLCDEMRDLASSYEQLRSRKDETPEAET